ncbi:DNA endonuclease RBBP8 [Echeneis naucrates]|nr:DNA endonuclease RBBP8 [Echeneis naucrates]
MSSPGSSCGTNKSAELFDELWRQLGECHQNTLRELEAKVSKLKTSRCLDAQRLDVFHTRNQQLKEQNKMLQNTISLLEKRLQVGECDRCYILEQKLRDDQDHSLRLIAKLETERQSLENEKGKLHTEVQKLTKTLSKLQQASSPEQEEGIIPDSPVLPSSLPVVNRLKKCKNVNKQKQVRYAELPLPQRNTSLLKELSEEPFDSSKNPGGAKVLVPGTCELDTSQISDVNDDLDEVIAETCVLELLVDKPHMKTKANAEHQSSSNPPWKSNVNMNPDSTAERSLSLLPRVKRFSEDCAINKAKRKKEESDNSQQMEERMEEHTQEEDRQVVKQTSIKQLLPKKVQSDQNGTLSQWLPTFKMPNRKVKKEEEDVKEKEPMRDLNTSHGQHDSGDAEHQVEPMWSIDPALSLSLNDSEWQRDQPKVGKNNEDIADTDGTWVSHSLLQGPDRTDTGCGPGKKANDSLDMMFDTTAYEEYKSYNNSHSGQSLACDADKSGDEENEEDVQNSGGGPTEDTPGQSKARLPTFAHVAVVRKKDERRKLKGTTCKECEVYYAHLPEEEKQKKLSACSRHRFLYIPPCTPENFWEVGFPSTQTCIDRGYIKEEKNPQMRLRRRLPLNALFSPRQERNQLPN